MPITAEQLLDELKAAVRAEKERRGMLDDETEGHDMPEASNNDDNTRSVAMPLNVMVEELEAISNLLTLLLNDLDSSFDEERGRRIGSGYIQLLFRRSGIEATYWLAGEIDRRVKKFKRQVDEQIVEQAEVA